MTDFTPQQHHEIRISAYRIAQDEIDNRAILDPEGELTTALAVFLYERRDDWASFDEADADCYAYEAVMDRFFGGRCDE